MMAKVCACFRSWCLWLCVCVCAPRAKRGMAIMCSASALYFFWGAVAAKYAWWGTWSVFASFAASRGEVAKAYAAK